MTGTIRCSAMLERLQSEHRHLNGALADVRRRLADLQVAAGQTEILADIAARLGALRDTLVAHFSHEEAGGCLEEAAMRCPSTRPLLKAIEAEHRELLPMLDKLLLDGRSEPASGIALSLRFEAFARKLREHEVAESRLLQYAFGGDASDYDVEGNE